MSLFPSTLPTYGEPDPTTAGLSLLGVGADTGRTILLEETGPEGRRVRAWDQLQSIESEHPISQATRGLPTRFEWPIALSVDPGSGATVTPLYRIDAPGGKALGRWRWRRSGG